MNKEQALAVFEDYKIRRVYDEKSETWFFSVVDIIPALLSAAGLSSCPKLLEGVEKSIEKRRQ